MKHCLLPFLILSCGHIYSQDTIQNLLFDLRFNKVSEIPAHRSGNHRSRASDIYLENYFYFLKSLTSGDDHSYREYMRQSEKNSREIRLLEDRDPEYLHFLSLLNIQSAIINLDHNEGWKAIRSYFTAIRMIRDNQEQYPGYFPDLMPLGIMEMIAGSLPAEYGWMMRWAGIEGTIASGQAKLVRYHAGCSSEDRLEATLVLGLSWYQFHPDEERAYKFLEHCSADYSGIVLYDYLLALAAQKAGHNDRTILILQQMIRENGGCGFPYACLLLGEAKLNRLDGDAAEYLHGFLEEYQGRNYIRMAYHKLSWYYFLNNDSLKYQQMRIRARASGRDLIEADRQAFLEATDTATLHPVLLKARLLFDGGYYSRGIDLLTGRIHPPLHTDKDSLELNYRMGRLYQKQGNHDRAEDHYLMVIRQGAGQPYYFIANALLQMGLMAEQERRISEAQYYYRTCLSQEKTQYRKSIDQKAKAGLERVNGRMR